MGEMYCRIFQRKDHSRHRLSAYELELLGLPNHGDMTRLRVECLKFGGEQLPKVTSNCGAPKFEIPKNVLENLLDEGFSIKEIATLLTISESNGGSSGGSGGGLPL